MKDRLIGSKVLLLVVLLALGIAASAYASVPPQAEFPVIITSAGQSPPDALMIKLLFDQLQAKKMCLKRFWSLNN